MDVQTCSSDQELPIYCTKCGGKLATCIKPIQYHPMSGVPQGKQETRICSKGYHRGTCDNMTSYVKILCGVGSTYLE